MKNTRNFDFWYTVILMFIVGVIAIVVAVYNWSNFGTPGHTICTIVACSALYFSATFLIEGFYPTVGNFKCPRCGGPVHQNVVFKADQKDAFQMFLHMVFFSIVNIFASYYCAKCGSIRGSEFPLMPRLIALMRSLRWLSLGTLALGAIIGVFSLIALSHH